MLPRLLCVLLAVAGASLAQPVAEDKPQPKLPTIALTIGDKTLDTEVADDDAERQKGMMFREKMADGTAMLFGLDAPQAASFWMKNTRVSLSVAYVSRIGMIMEIYDLKPRDEKPVSSKFDTIAYAIEVPQGWFLKNGILPGAAVQGLPPLPRR